MIDCFSWEKATPGMFPEGRMSEENMKSFKEYREEMGRFAHKNGSKKPVLIYDGVLSIDGMKRSLGRFHFESETRTFGAGSLEATVGEDRYGGAYSGGQFIAAFGDRAHFLALACFQDDVEAREFFNSGRSVYGAGNTPEEAIDDLSRKILNRDGR